MQRRKKRCALTPTRSVPVQKTFPADVCCSHPVKVSHRTPPPADCFRALCLCKKTFPRTRIAFAFRTCKENFRHRPPPLPSRHEKRLSQRKMPDIRGKVRDRKGGRMFGNLSPTRRQTPHTRKADRTKANQNTRMTAEHPAVIFHNIYAPALCKSREKRKKRPPRLHLQRKWNII